MKKSLLLIVAAIGFAAFGLSQNPITVAGWTFPTGIDTVDVLPDLGLDVNEGYYLSAEDTTPHPATIHRQVFMQEGVTTFAGTVYGWNDGNGAKLWSIKIKAPECSDIKVSSKQVSPDGTGPKDWKIQARLSNGDWVDLEGGTVTCGTEWSTGTVEDLALPQEFNNPSGSLYIRWIMTSNTNINGGTVDSSGVSKIDDVIVSANGPAGIVKLNAGDNFEMFPNPVQDGMVTINSIEQIKVLKIFDSEGRFIDQYQKLSHETTLNLSELKSGVYYLEAVYSDETFSVPQKLIIQ